MSDLPDLQGPEDFETFFMRAQDEARSFDVQCQGVRLRLKMQEDVPQIALYGSEAQAVAMAAMAGWDLWTTERRGKGLLLTWAVRAEEDEELEDPGDTEDTDQRERPAPEAEDPDDEPALPDPADPPLPADPTRHRLPGDGRTPESPEHAAGPAPARPVQIPALPHSGPAPGQSQFRPGTRLTDRVPVDPGQPPVPPQHIIPDRLYHGLTAGGWVYTVIRTSSHVCGLRCDGLGVLHLKDGTFTWSQFLIWQDEVGAC